MADAWTHPLVVEALTSTREGLAEPLPVVPYPHMRMPEFNQPANMHRWSPWVRNIVLQQALLDSIDLTIDPQEQTVTLQCFGKARLPMKRPTKSQFQAQIGAVLSYAALRTERSAEIVTQIDGQGPFWAALLPVRLGLVPHLEEVLTAVLQLAVFVEMRFKHTMACPRPLEWSPQVQPMISTPGHGTFPMGHAVQIFAVGHVLKALVRDAVAPNPLAQEWLLQLDRLACRVSENRIVAGLHFPVDLWAGLGLGIDLGRYAVARFRAEEPAPLPEAFLNELNPLLADGDGFATPSIVTVMASVNDSLPPLKRAGKTPSRPAGGVLEEAWAHAVTELRRALT